MDALMDLIKDLAAQGEAFVDDLTLPLDSVRPKNLANPTQRER
jgi:hypothetical protein